MKVGSNLRLMRKLEKLSYETEMRSWLVDPDGSDEELLVIDNKSIPM